MKNLLFALLATLFLSSVVLAQAKPEAKKEATKATQTETKASQSDMKKAEKAADTHDTAVATQKKMTEHHRTASKYHSRMKKSEDKEGPAKMEKSSATEQVKTKEALKGSTPVKVTEKPVQKKE